MFWKKKPVRGTGLITENVNWFFWDDVFYPGLIDRATFSNLKKATLTEEEYSRLILAEGRSDMITGGKRNIKAIKERDAYYAKIGKFLTTERERDPDRVKRLIINRWNSNNRRYPLEGLEMFKAYLNVWMSWDLPCDWEDASDVHGEPTFLVVAEKVIGRLWRRYCVNNDDIVRIIGRPDEFSLELREVKWRFDGISGRRSVL